MRQLSGNDAFMLYLETPSTPNHMMGIEIYDPTTAPHGAVSFDDVLAATAARIHVAPGLRQRLVRVPFGLDHPWWADDQHFDLEYHVREIALPSPGTWRQLCTQAARIHSRPLDLSRPPWELYLVSGLTGLPGLPPGCFALLLRYHHTLVDGTTGTQLTNAIHDRDPDAKPPPPPGQPWSPEPGPGEVELLVRAGLNLVTKPVRLVRATARTLPVTSRLATLLGRPGLALPSVAAPMTRFNGPISSSQVSFAARRFDFADLERIRGAGPGVTINDVGLAIIAGGLRRYLLAHDELPDRSLQAIVPISLHSRGPKPLSGNEFGEMVVSLHTDVADPLARLAAIQRSTSTSKTLTEAIGARTLTQFSDELPGLLIGAAMRAQVQLSHAAGAVLGANLVASNVPGPPRPLYFAGATMVANYGIAPLVSWMGLTNVLHSYAGSITVNVTAAREMLPDPERYGDGVQESFEELLRAVN